MKNLGVINRLDWYKKWQKILIIYLNCLIFDTNEILKF